MALEWFTYAALGERLGISPEAVRQRSMRQEWSKRTGNDGRAEVRVDVEELLAAQPPAPHAKLPSDVGPTVEQPPVDPPFDGRSLDAMIASLREMIGRADAEAERERERAADERSRADSERGRADASAVETAQLRERAEQVEAAVREVRGERDRLRGQVEQEVARKDALAAELAEVRADGRRQVADVERDVAQLRAMLDDMRRPAEAYAREAALESRIEAVRAEAAAPRVLPWWRRLAG